jgi:magnesium transporter
VALLRTSDAVQAAATLGNLAFEQQQSLFRHLPLELAAVVVQFPYYHEYVLLYSLPAGKMRALVDKLNPNDRMRFFDELPEEAWQRLMDELSSAEAAETSGQEPETARAHEEQPPQPGEPIIEGYRWRL